MRMFGVPFDIDQEDKLIGGMLSLRQSMWIGIPIAALVWALVDTGGYLSENGINGFVLVIRIFMVIVVAVVAGFFAFGTMDGTNADKYILRMIKFKRKKKVVKYSDKIRG